MSRIVQVKRLTTVDAVREHLDGLGVADAIGLVDAPDPDGPLARPFVITDGAAGPLAVGNRFAVLPMEGWDAEPDGRPSDLVRRRWRRFGESGAKLVWGGEAVAVDPDGRANPRQLVIGSGSGADLAGLRQELVDAHAAEHGSADGLVVGLQLTHSGRWSRPHGDPAPLVAYHHPVLDGRAPGPVTVLTDEDLDRLADRYVRAAALAADAGFDFVDVKHCHGYLLHELLSAIDRPGRYGGDLAHRTAFLRRVVERIRATVPALAVGVRLSAYDLVPFRAGPDGAGVPDDAAPGAARHAFGGDGTGTGVDLAETHGFVAACRELGIGTVCVTAGSPYYNPHAQRPAYFPPSDGYRPPHDPLIDVARMLAATAELSREHPDVAFVGSGYSYLQQWLPHAAEHTVRSGGAASVGIGRGMLSYPRMPADVLAGRPLDTRSLCRTFSDCTTAPRHGMVSGCYPLDDYYHGRPERVELAAVKRRTRRDVRG